MAETRLSPYEVGQLIAGMQNASALDRLDAIFAQASATRTDAADATSAESAGSEKPERATATAEAVTSNPDMFRKEREALGIPETHPNCLYVNVLMTHTNKEMNNWGRDNISDEAMKEALPTMLFQPVDVSDSFNHHERERNTWVNGIRGFVYAAKLVKDPENPDQLQLWCGVVIWARDFPEIATRILQDHAILGASWDLLFSGFSMNEDGSRNLLQIQFLGGTILYKSRAADPDTQLGYLHYLGSELTDDSTQSGRKDSMKENKETAAEVKPEATVETAAPVAGDVNLLTEANTAMAQMVSQVTQLSAKIAELEGKVNAAEAAKSAADERASQAEAKLAEIEAQAQEAERSATRMTELKAIGAFDDETAETEASTKVGALSDTDYALFKAGHEANVAKAAAAKLQKQLEVVAQLLKDNGIESEAAIIHTAPPLEDAPTVTGPHGTVHNGPAKDEVPAEEAQASAVTTTGMSAINGGASTASADTSTKTPRQLGRKAAKLSNAGK